MYISYEDGDTYIVKDVRVTIQQHTYISPWGARQRERGLSTLFAKPYPMNKILLSLKKTAMVCILWLQS